MEERQKRQVAYKVSVKEVLEGEYVKEEGWTPNFIRIHNNHVSRVNIIGIIIGIETDGGGSSALIDDGTGRISLRSFENPQIFQQFSVGDIILIVGRPREFGDQRYLVGEVIKKIENNDWVLLRKKELDSRIQKEKVEIIQESSDVEGNDVLLDLIKKLDSGRSQLFKEVFKQMFLGSMNMVCNLLKISNNSLSTLNMPLHFRNFKSLFFLNRFRHLIFRLLQ